MRVLHVVPYYIPAWRYGGPIRSVHGLSRELVRGGAQVDVVTTSVDGAADSDVPHDRPVDIDGVRVFYFRSRNLRRLYYSRELSRHLDETMAGYDIVHLHGVFLWPGWRAARIARRNRVPFVTSPRGMLVRDLIRMRSRWVKTAWIHGIERKTLADAGAVIASTRHERDEIQKLGLRMRQILIHPNGIEVGADPGPRAIDPAERRVLYLGRLSREKGLDRLLPALALLPDVTLDLAGNDETGYRDELESQIARLGLGGRVRFLGHLNEEQKWKALRAAPLLVLPSYSENFGVVVLEAMSMRTPVVLTSGVGVADAVARYGGGVVVSGEAEALAAGIRELLEDPVKREAMEVRARQVIEEHFTWDGIAKAMRETYDQVIRSNDASTRLS
ncbi:MAG: glycosyltransferase [Acidobacteriota bacterium]|nr:glycosyltransferase [Acidobacteriota bacterium]MDH3786203.1 glycosyltransferase [Acidobacteriota bacterium]